MNHYDHIHPSNYLGAGIFPQLLIFLPFVMLLILYFYAVIFSSRRFKPWPFYRNSMLYFKYFLRRYFYYRTVSKSCASGF